MKNELLNEFKKIYDDEEVAMMFYVEHKQQLFIQCKSGYAYKVSYNGGCIETECIGE